MDLEDDQGKLANAVESFTKLKTLLTFSSDNCRKMVELLTQFDDRLYKLEETVQPVYKETGNLQRQQENINSTLSRLDYVIKFYTVAGEVEPNIINALPGSSSMYNEYIRDLNRLSEAVCYFERNNPESPELMNCYSLLEKGGQIIEKEFIQNMSRHSEEIKKVDVILDMIKNNGPKIQKDVCLDNSVSKNENDLCNNDLMQSFEEKNLMKILKLSSNDGRNSNLKKIINDFKILAEWLCSNRNQDFVLLYSKLRSEVLTKSLKNLRSYLKSLTLGAMINAFGDHLSPLLGGRKNLHLIKTDSASSFNNEMSVKSRSSLIRRLQDASMDMLQNSSINNISKLNQSYHHSTAIAQYSLIGADSKDQLDQSISEREIFSYVITVSGLLKLMQLELILIENIIPVEDQKIIFSRLINGVLESVYHEGDQLSSRVKRSMQKQDFSSALYLLPVLRYHAYMRHSFDLLLDGCEPQVANRLYSLVVTLQTTISKTLEEFIEYVKSDVHHRVPKDGTVHELTSNVMLFLVHLQSYLDILSRVVTITDIQCLEMSGDKNRIAFAQYICRVLCSLGLSLRKRSESYNNEPTLQALFRLNNTHYILKTLINSSLLSIVLLYKNEIQNDYIDQIKDFKLDYLQCWNKVIQYLIITDESNGILSPISQQGHNIMYNNNLSLTLPTSFSTGSSRDVKLKDKDRQMIKDKFTGFNREFEAVINAHKSYAIPDKDLREELRQEHIELIVPLYQQFYNKYVCVDFTKNVHKYIKYLPDHVLQAMIRLFDDLA